MKKDRSVEPEFETPNDDEEFEQDLKDLFDDYKEEAPAAKATGEQPEETSTEAKSQPEENEKEETAKETPATELAEQEEAEEKKAPELEKPAETKNKAEEIAVEAPAEAAVAIKYAGARTLISSVRETRYSVREFPRFAKFSIRVINNTRYTI